MRLPSNPVIYEINTWPWLHGLSATTGSPVTLATVPENVWDDLADLRVDAIWLMGVWQRSAAGVAIALGEEGLVSTFAEALPDYTSADVLGSPYSVADYSVDPHLGGSAGLAAARAELARRGIGLILDFVPNHVAIDHPWAADHPNRFIQGTAQEATVLPREFVPVGDTIIANGRDPYFAPWTDVLQLNAFDDDLRVAATDTVLQIADQCDGIRCDMAMLLLNEIFARTWGDRAGPAPKTEYWDEVIGATKQAHPDFVFIAEAYWDTEAALIERGFDYCYDKAVTDALRHDPPRIAELIRRDPASLSASVHFVENHDEDRAQAVFGDRHRTAAIAALTLPGARLIYDGQLEGRTVQLPVQLGREPAATPVPGLPDFYRRLLDVLADDTLHTGEFRPLPVLGWPDRGPGPGLTAWSWSGTQRWLIVVNLDDGEGAGLVPTGWSVLDDAPLTLTDPVAGAAYPREPDGTDRAFVLLAGWSAQVLRLDPA